MNVFQTLIILWFYGQLSAINLVTKLYNYSQSTKFYFAIFPFLISSYSRPSFRWNYWYYSVQLLVLQNNTIPVLPSPPYLGVKNSPIIPFSFEP